MNSPCLFISCLFLFYKVTFIRSETEKKKKFSFDTEKPPAVVGHQKEKILDPLFKFKNHQKIKYEFPSVMEKSFQMQ